MRYFWVCVVGIVAFSPVAARAGCLNDQYAFTSCQIAGRNTEVFVCYDDQIATYSYGPRGEAPDLFLSETIENVDFEAWSGSGSAIHETVTFYNEGFSYSVGGGFERPFSDAEMALGGRHFGWLEVAQNGEVLSRLECVPETVTYGFGAGIYDAKVAAGLNWDDYSKTWVPAAPAGRPILRMETQLRDGGDCLPATEFNFGDVAMGDPVELLGKLGSPEASGVFTLGGQEIDRMTITGMNIDIFQNVVIGMTATSASWKMPSGLRVGLTRGGVIQILGRVPNGEAPTSDRFSALVCLDDQDALPEWYAVFSFGQDKRVESISFASLSP